MEYRSSVRSITGLDNEKRYAAKLGITEMRYRSLNEQSSEKLQHYVHQLQDYGWIRASAPYWEENVIIQKLINVIK